MVLAVDTNIVVRLIVNDDEQQVAAIRKAMETNDFMVPLSVILETEWVLRSRYRYGRDRILTALQAIIALEGIEVEKRQDIEWALARYRYGADLGDMLHLVAAGPVDGFLTLDADMKKRAGRNPPVGITMLRA